MRLHLIFHLYIHLLKWHHKYSPDAQCPQAIGLTDLSGQPVRRHCTMARFNSLAAQVYVFCCTRYQGQELVHQLLLVLFGKLNQSVCNSNQGQFCRTYSINQLVTVTLGEIPTQTSRNQECLPIMPVGQHQLQLGTIMSTKNPWIPMIQPHGKYP
ncbi:hypothetical protein OH76DRAFT_1424039 [Lentinus brumalis]|uniref:Uncharacterized protein n=1 Tax=Lentinus brumalis TaxID=2498619 RepID=A0A371CHY6_9APHY|nr:hypothetical protein OH76DRAFT_1424039 [Polyporus brumalis]